MIETTQRSFLAQLIRERRSIKTNYTDEPVTKELILELLEDAVWAPNHGLREPWRFIFVGAESKREFAEQLVATYPAEQHEIKRRYFGEPSAYLIVVMPVDHRQKQWDEDYGAVSSMIQNFQLLAWERKLGVVWKTNTHNYDPKVRKLLGVEAGEKIVGFLHLGFFHDAPSGKERTPAPVKFTEYKPAIK